MGDLVRSMNCYYSNLIEGPDTHPRDIDRALYDADYSNDAQKTALKLEAVASIEIQRVIDSHDELQTELEHLVVAANKVRAEKSHKGPTVVVLRAKEAG